MLAAVPDDEAALKKLFGIAEVEQPGLSLQDAVQRPSLNIRGLSSAYVGAERAHDHPRPGHGRHRHPAREGNAVGRDARAPEGPHREAGVLPGRPRPRRCHARGARADREADGGGRRDQRLPRRRRSRPASRQIVAAITRMFGQPPVQIRTMGGTVPIAPFIEAMGVPAVGVPIVNFDNNQHGENENLRMGTFFTGITTLAAVLTAPVPGAR